MPTIRGRCSARFRAWASNSPTRNLPSTSTAPAALSGRRKPSFSGASSPIEGQGGLISKPYVEITLNVMRRFGGEVARSGWRYFELPAAGYASPGKIFVEGDASSASYFLAAGALGGGPVRVEGVGRASIQGDVGFATALMKMGANVAMGDDWIEVRGVGNDNGKLDPIDMDFNLIPDAAMTIAVAALFADGTTTLRNIASWRV